MAKIRTATWQDSPARRPRRGRAARGGREDRRAASCCRTPPSRSRSAARCSRSARASCSTTASAPPSASSKGDEVLFGKYGGTDVEVDGEEIKILRESDILAKIVK